jgi:hypothetical protein
MRCLLSVVLLLSGCQTAPIEPDPIEPAPDLRPVVAVSTTIVPIEPSAIVIEHDLSAIRETPTGVAIESGRTLVLTAEGALYDLATGQEIWRGAPSTNPFGYTDVASVRPGWLAITSLSEGLLLELETGEMAPHFCFEPGWWEPEVQDPVQLSNAVANDPIGGRIYAQPRTFEGGGAGAVVESFVAAYDQSGGADLTWWIMDVGFVANGMAVLPRAEGQNEPALLLGTGSTLHRFDTGAGELSALTDLADLGVSYIEGLAIDEAAGTVLVLDGGSRKLFELRLSALEQR